MECFVDIGLRNAALAIPLALMAWLLGLLIRRPAARHVLWLIVLLRLMAPVLWEISIPRPAAFQRPSAVEPSAGTASSAMAQSEEADDESNSVSNRHSEPAIAASIPSFDTVPSDSSSTTTQTSETANDTVKANNSAEIAAGAQDVTPSIFPWRVRLGWTWLTASGLVFCILASRLIQFVLALRHSRLGAESIQFQTERVGRKLGLRRVPRVYLVGARVSPMLFGLIGCPRLIVPASLWERLDLSQRSALLAHELAHYRRGDYLVRGLELVASIFFWWHPVLWLAKWQLRETEEQCCDAWVVWALPHRRREYATAIVDTVGYLSEGRTKLPALASGVGQVRYLKRRLTMIMCDKMPRRSPPLLLVTILLSGLAFVTLGTAWGDDRAPQNPREQSRDEPPATNPDTGRLPEAQRQPRDRSDDSAPQNDPIALRRELERARAEVDRARRHLEEVERRLERSRNGRLPGEPEVPMPREARPGAGALPRGAGGRPDQPAEPRLPGRQDQPGDGLPRPDNRLPERAARSSLPGVPGAGGADRGSLEQRMQAMDRQLHEMLRLMEEMRRDMDRSGGNGRRSADPKEQRPDPPGREPGLPGRPSPNQDPNTRGDDSPARERRTERNREDLPQDPIRP